MNLPADNFVLLSLINTKLRDCYSSFSELCVEEDVDGDKVTARLKEIGYLYDPKTNSFK